MISFLVTAVHVDPDMPHALSILTLLTQVPDPRHRRGRRHRLEVILALAVAAVKAVEASAWISFPGARQVLHAKPTAPRTYS